MHFTALEKLTGVGVQTLHSLFPTILSGNNVAVL